MTTADKGEYPEWHTQRTPAVMIRDYGRTQEGIGDVNSEAKGSNKALTFDEGKEPLANLPWAAVKALSRVQQYGHSKYKDFNNYRKGMEVTRNLSCAMRHIVSYLEGIDNDHESGEPHLAHAMCRIGFVLQNIHDKTEIDDRFKKP